MSPDNYQEAWKAQSSQTRVTVDADLLLQEVRRSQESFRTMILLRDYREAGIAILLIPVWFFLGIKFSEPWTWYLTVPALIWVAGFIIVDRMRRKPKRTQPDDPILESARASLVEVEHQIWLLKNVAWWYLLPLLVPILVFVGQVVLQLSQSWWGAIGTAAPVYAVLVALYTGIYYLNQYAVRVQLEPRRQELLALMSSLSEVASADVRGSYPILMGAKCGTSLTWRKITAGLLAALLLLSGIAGYLYLRYAGDGQSRGAVQVGKSDPSTPLAVGLENIRAANKLPAMAAFTLRGGAIVERATVGTVSAKNDTLVTDDAQWHLGSNTKAMTATVAGVLVDEGLLRWDSTLGEVLGKAAPNMDAENRDTTLAMLLHHRSGIAANFNWWSAPEDRVACAAQILASPPTHKGEFAYSNAGYVVAGAMMEAVTGKRWEDLMKDKLFGPLGMRNTGFGPPSSPGSPWGHASGLLGWKPMDPALPGSDNPPVMGPAGTIHTTMEDYSLFLAAQLKGAQGKDGIVRAETFRIIHTAADGGEYAMGWNVAARDWAGGRVFTHSGSNTLWYTTVWIAPEKDMVYFAVTNAGGNTAGTAVNEAIELLIGRQSD